MTTGLKERASAEVVRHADETYQAIIRTQVGHYIESPCRESQWDSEQDIRYLALRLSLHLDYAGLNDRTRDRSGKTNNEGHNHAHMRRSRIAAHHLSAIPTRMVFPPPAR